MEEYIEDILEDNDSTMDLLESLDFDNEAIATDWSDMMVDDDYLYKQ